MAIEIKWSLTLHCCTISHTVIWQIAHYAIAFDAHSISGIKETSFHALRIYIVDFNRELTTGYRVAYHLATESCIANFCSGVRRFVAHDEKAISTTISIEIKDSGFIL